MSLTPFRHRNAGMTRVPSGVSKNVDGSLRVARDVSVLNLTNAAVNASVNDLFVRENEWSLFAVNGLTVESFVLGKTLSPME